MTSGHPSRQPDDRLDMIDQKRDGRLQVNTSRDRFEHCTHDPEEMIVTLSIE